MPPPGNNVHKLLDAVAKMWRFSRCNSSQASMAWSDIRPGSERSHKMKAVRTTAIVIAGLSVTTVLLWQHAQVKLLSSENTVLHNRLSQIASLQETNSQL